MSANLENSAMATGPEKVSFHSNPKESPDYIQLHSFHMLAKFAQNPSSWAKTVYCTPGVQAGFRKGRESRDQIANIHWIMEKVRDFQKNSYFCFIDHTKAFDTKDFNKL